jgi:hypothetical protein
VIMAKIKSIKKAAVKFEDVKKWFDENIHPNVIDFNDPKPYEVYEKGHFAGVFQCIDEKSLITMGDCTQKSIDKIVVGNIVKVYDEVSHEFINSTVDCTFDQGIKECIELTFDDGSTLVCTIDHLILTQQGWIKAGDLTDEDDIKCFNALP